jgi:hypothetical protein
MSSHHTPTGPETKEKESRRRHRPKPTDDGRNGNSSTKIQPPDERENHHKSTTQSRNRAPSRSRSRGPGDGEKSQRSKARISSQHKSKAPANENEQPASRTSSSAPSGWQHYPKDHPRCRPHPDFYIGYTFSTIALKGAFVRYLIENTHKDDYEIVEDDDKKYAILLPLGTPTGHGGLPKLERCLYTWVKEYRKNNGEDSIGNLGNPYKMSLEEYIKIKTSDSYN